MDPTRPSRTRRGDNPDTPASGDPRPRRRRRDHAPAGPPPVIDRDVFVDPAYHAREDARIAREAVVRDLDPLAAIVGSRAHRRGRVSSHARPAAGDPAGNRVDGGDAVVAAPESTGGIQPVGSGAGVGVRPDAGVGSGGDAGDSPARGGSGQPAAPVDASATPEPKPKRIHLYRRTGADKDDNLLDGPWVTRTGQRGRFTPKPHVDNDGDAAHFARHRRPTHLVRQAKALGLPVTAYAQTLTLAIRRLRGGRAAFLSYVSLAASGGSELAQKFWDVFCGLRVSEQRVVDLDLVASSAGVPVSPLLGDVISTAHASHVDVSQLIAVAALPATMAAAVESAQDTKSAIGLKDRHALLQKYGLIAAPKSTSVHVTASAHAQAAAAAASNPSVPSFLDAAHAADRARAHVQRTLTTGAPIEADILDDDGDDVDDALQPSRTSTDDVEWPETPL